MPSLPSRPQDVDVVSVTGLAAPRPGFLSSVGLLPVAFADICSTCRTEACFPANSPPMSGDPSSPSAALLRHFLIMAQSTEWPHQTDRNGGV